MSTQNRFLKQSMKRGNVIPVAFDLVCRANFYFKGCSGAKRKEGGRSKKNTGYTLRGISNDSQKYKITPRASILSIFYALVQ